MKHFSQMPDALVLCGTMLKVKWEENLFFGEIWLSPQNARTKLSLLYQFMKESEMIRDLASFKGV